MFLTWEEIADIIVEEVENRNIKIVSQEGWGGSSFLADKWNLSSQKVEILQGFSP